MKTPKIKISDIDMDYFDPKDFQIDDYWQDLYNPEKIIKNLKN